MNLKRLRNGCLFSFCAGLGAFALSWPMLALLAPVGTDLVDAWRRTADVPVTGILVVQAWSFVAGYRRNSRRGGA